MTYTEALKVLSEELKYRISGYYDHLQAGGQCDPNEECYFDVLQKAIEALEKQMPKKVIYHDNYGNPTPNQPRCPRCYEAGNDTWHWAGESYCEYCGQLMKWSE